MEPQATTAEGTAAEPQTGLTPRPARGPIGLTVLALAFAAGALAAAMLARSQLSAAQARLTALETTAARLETGFERQDRATSRFGSAITYLSDEQVDLGNPRLQHLRHGFAVSELKLTNEGGALIVTGRIINATSLRHRSATFRMKVAS